MIIDWKRPDCLEEVAEYFTNAYTNSWLTERDICYHAFQDLTKHFNEHYLIDYPLEKLETILNIKPFDKNERIYLESFYLMEETMILDQQIILPAPIVLSVQGEDFLFAGSKRCFLARKYNLALRVLYIDTWSISHVVEKPKEE